MQTAPARFTPAFQPRAGSPFMPTGPSGSSQTTGQTDVLAGTDIAVLTSVFEPDCQIACWQRNAPEGLSEAIETAVSASMLSSGFRVVVEPGEVESALPHAVQTCAPLADDIAFLVELYADLLGCAKVGLRLEYLHTAMCPRFHVDRTGIRMLCTYRGPGTEWLDSKAAERSRLGVAAGASDEASGLIRDPAGVGRASRLEVVLLKGSLWQGNGQRGAIHRSPAVAPGEAPRSTLALDAIW